MWATFNHKDKTYQVDLDSPLDISIPLADSDDAVNCFHAPPFKVTPLVAGSFIGDTAKGSPVNFMNIQLNPHGNGTHTECVGHIAKEKYTIHRSLKKFHFVAKLISVSPSQIGLDKVIDKSSLKDLIGLTEVEALIIRTLPNSDDKLTRNYSGQNPTYFSPEAMQLIVDCGVQHLLTDQPSVDREEDDGKLTAHKIFWNYPQNPRTKQTITELIFVDNNIIDGDYLLNLQITSFEVDATPSKPVLYKMQQT